MSDHIIEAVADELGGLKDFSVPTLTTALVGLYLADDPEPLRRFENREHRIAWRTRQALRDAVKEAIGDE